jgi:hypothetical protein
MSLMAGNSGEAGLAVSENTSFPPRSEVCKAGRACVLNDDSGGCEGLISLDPVLGTKKADYWRQG